MLSPTVVIATLAGSFLTSLVLTRLVLAWLARHRILDRPNDRSSHGRPTPRGGGLAVIGVALVAFVAVAYSQGLPAAGYGVPAAALALAAVSWRDDRRGVPIGARLAIQIAAVAAGLAVSPGILAAAGDWVGPVVGPILIGVAWVWFVNLFNFMDGIDGLAGAEAASIGLGLLLLAGLGGIAAADGLSGAALAGAALGFLAWNWHPARVFLGDVGSIPLGFLIGWLLLRAAAEGAWAAALILPGYFLVDATVTLVRRAVRGDTPWQAHREHAYQRALARWPRHDVVTLQIAALNVGLIGLAAVSALTPRHEESLLGAAALLILIVVAWLGSAAERTR